MKNEPVTTLFQRTCRRLPTELHNAIWARSRYYRRRYGLGFKLGMGVPRRVMPTQAPELDRLKLYVTHQHQVMVQWIDGVTSGTITLTPEQAVEIGAMGRMAKARRGDFDGPGED